jgi:hypothetical protein
MKTPSTNPLVLPLHPTHYECLGVPEQASAAALAQVDWQNPPLNAITATEANRWLAYAVLSDPFRREVYDQYLERERAKLAAASQRKAFWRRPSRRAIVLSVIFGTLGLGVWWWLRAD